MVTVLVEKWGNSTGPNEYAQFQTYAALGYSEKDSVKGYHIYKRCYVVVSTGNTGFQGTITHTNWSDDFQMYLSGTYVDSDWVDDGWVSPGSTYSVEGVAYYDSDNGARYTSTASASYTASSKTVIYDANGGTDAPKSQTTLADAEITLSLTKPTRTGYTFKGWATSKTATTANYQPGNKYTNKSSVTLYAVWQINTWTVSYNNNGGTGTIANQTKTYGKALTLSNGSGFSKTGYILKSWNTNSAGTGTTYNLGASYTGNAALLLYAKWQIDTYTIYYNKNTTDTVSNMPNNQTKTYGKTLALSSNIPTRAGYGFQGWATSANGEVVYAAGANYTANNNATLYAVWKADTYVVSYNANAGDDAVIVPRNQSKEYNVPLTLSSDVPTRKQYKFKYWTNAQGTIQYHPGDTYSLNESITLYAVWELTASKVTIYDNMGNPQSYLCYVYDESGVPHYAIVSIYDAQGVPHSVT